MTKKMRLFTSNIKEFTLGVVASLVATFIYTYFSQFARVGKNFNLQDFFNAVISYKFFMYWCLALLILFGFIVIRWFIRAKIDSLQALSPIILGFSNHHDLKGNVENEDFKWIVYANIKSEDPRTREILEVRVDRVDGPFCKNDFREMKVSRTFFGRYKYKCPKCPHKVFSLKNRRTLECEVGDEIEADYRRDTYQKINQQ